MAEATQSQIRAEQLVGKLLADSTVSAKVREQAKALFADDPPNFPEDRLEPMTAALREQMEAQKAELDAMREERAADKKAAEDAAAKTNLDNALAAAKEKYGLTSEGFEKMVERMRETQNFTDAEAAAAWVAQANPPVKAPKNTYGSGSINIFEGGGEDEAKQLLTNPESFLDAQLNKFAQDPDAYVRETFGQ